MQIPAWIFAAVGIMVILFGAWRIRLSFRSEDDEAAAKKRGGLYGVGRRSHLLIGVVYILLGVYLLLGAFGIRIVPFGGS